MTRSRRLLSSLSILCLLSCSRFTQLFSIKRELQKAAFIFSKNLSSIFKKLNFLFSERKNKIMPQIVAFSGDLLNRQTNLNKRRHSLIASTTDEVKNSFNDVNSSDGQKYHSSACFETGNFQVKMRPFLTPKFGKTIFLTRLAVTVARLRVKVQAFNWVRVQ